MVRLRVSLTFLALLTSRLGQNWRGNVKARLFVMTLQDHYRDEFERTAHAPGAVSTDQWALKYLNSQGLWPIMEAFDDDASGYVTITEVNKLMDLRPPSLGWR